MTATPSPKYSVFETAEIYEQWIAIVNQQFGYPNGNTGQYTNRIDHPTSGQVACFYKTGQLVQPPTGSQVVEEDYMIENGWFKRNGEQTTEPQ